MKKTISLKIDEADYKKLRAIALEEDLSMSHLIRYSIRRFLGYPLVEIKKQKS